MPWATIIKSRREWETIPNLHDYESIRAHFTWEQTRQGLEGLPRNKGLNIAHEAVDRRRCVAYLKSAPREAFDEPNDRGRERLSIGGGAREGQLLRISEAVVHLAEHIHEVPVHVIPCVEGRIDGADNFGGASFYGSILPGVWNFQLAVRSGEAHAARARGGGPAGASPTGDPPRRPVRVLRSLRPDVVRTRRRRRRAAASGGSCAALTANPSAEKQP